jgi:hypothetical protein
MEGLFKKVKGGFKSGGTHYASPVLPDGTSMEVFKNYPAKLLKSLGDFNSGDVVSASTSPNGIIYLEYGEEGVFYTNAKCGVDFIFI